MRLPCNKYYPDIFTGVQSWQTVKSGFPAYRSLIVHYRTHRATQLTQNVTRIRQAGRKFVPRPQTLPASIRVSLQSFRYRLIRKPDSCRVWKWKIKYSSRVKKKQKRELPLVPEYRLIHKSINLLFFRVFYDFFTLKIWNAYAFLCIWSLWIDMFIFTYVKNE